MLMKMFLDLKSLTQQTIKALTKSFEIEREQIIEAPEVKTSF